MLFKNVFRTLKKQYVQLLLLGVIITLSSFIYTAMDYGVGGIKGPAEEYFELANQEDFAISIMDFMLEEDINYVVSNCEYTGEIVYTLSALKDVNSTCYYKLMDHRMSLIDESYDDISIELREYKNIYFDIKKTIPFHCKVHEMKQYLFMPPLRRLNIVKHILKKR